MPEQEKSEYAGTGAGKPEASAVIPGPSRAAGPNGAQSAPHESWGWTRRQRIGLGVLLAMLFAILTYQYIRRPANLDDPSVVVDGQSVSLPRQINPNTATLQELARIPHIGDTLATKIIAYRDARVPIATGGVVFRQVSDLDKVPGIGKKVLEQIAPFLEFPETPASDPAGS